MGCGGSKQTDKVHDSSSLSYNRTGTTHPGTIVKKETPHSESELKYLLKKCVEENRLVVFEDVDHDQEWCQVCTDKEIVVIDTKHVEEEMVKHLPSVYGVDELTTEDLNSCQNIKDRLQQRVGRSPKLEVEAFVNWGKTIHAKVISAYPETKEEMQSLVMAAAAEGVRVRCAGRRHSWAPLFPDERHLLINVERMTSDYPDGSKIRMSKRDPIEVDMMTGISTGDLKKFQLENKVNLPCNVILDVVQMVSVVATACHGVGYDAKGLSDYVVKMRIFDSTGKLRTYSWEDKKMMLAVAGNFGAFGVIYDMTMRLEEEVIVETQNRYFDLEDLFYDAKKLKKLVEENWSLELFWFPYNSLSLFDYNPKRDDVWARIINKTKKKVDIEDGSYYTWKDTKDYLTQEGLRTVAPSVVGDPSLTPYFAWTAFKGLKHIIYPSGTLYQELPHAVHFRKYIHLQAVNDMEFAFDFKGDYSKLLKVIQTVVNKVDHYEEKDEYPLNIALEMRWMAYSDVYLCPASIGSPANGGSGHVCYIEVLSFTGTKGWEKFCVEVAKEWTALGGMPHLSKQWEFIPGIYEHIHKLIGKGIDKFREQLARSGADPDGMFLNESVRKLLKL